MNKQNIRGNSIKQYVHTKVVEGIRPLLARLKSQFMCKSSERTLYGREVSTNALMH